jgi:hypothetical protein
MKYFTPINLYMSPNYMSDASVEMLALDNCKRKDILYPGPWYY